ncbi:discoidin domain-containing protein [Actinokineospora xionganensis]|uniref:Discoidin domain-containing protein n=1 Tax=Actinokineospora xionganensis TaxID=2684470 RepID=A0ABR7L340_9PSEU|nr:discoidin domain-containing protein [Actinokineospora xionganensis]MBC6446997.1 discoidin domain-containing protein [Actinokineospora xionganensis]
MGFTRLGLIVAAGVVVTPYVLYPGLDGGGHGADSTDHHIVPAAAAMVPVAPALARDGWTVKATSERPDARASNVLDGDPSTIWHSAADSQHSITIDMRRTQRVSGLAYTPRPDGGNGAIGRYEVRLSTDGETWSDPVSKGVALDDASVKTMSFAVSGARFVRLTSLAEAGDRGPWASAAELTLFGDPGGPVPSTPLARGDRTTTAGDKAITLDLKAPMVVTGLTYRHPGARVGEYRVSVSTDGKTFGPAVASGVWEDGDRVKDTVFAGQVTGRFVRLSSVTGSVSEKAEIDLVGPVPGGAAPLSRYGWTATASDEDTANPAANMVDGRQDTVWRGQRGQSSKLSSFTVDLRREQPVSSIALAPRNPGGVANYSVAVSTDGTTFGAPVASGTWSDDGLVKTAVLRGTPNTRYVRVTSTAQAVEGAEFYAYAAIDPASTAPLDRTGWSAVASDEETDPRYDGRAALAIDGTDTTMWHSKWTGVPAPLPHWITLDMKSAKTVVGIRVQPRGDGLSGWNGRIGQYQLRVSNDGVNFGDPVAAGTWPDTSNPQMALLNSAVSARYVRLTALTEAGNRGPWTTIPEINVLTPAPPPDKSKAGSWSAVNGYPLIPVATAVLPNNKLLMWSAYLPDNFGGTHGYTQTAILDLTTGNISNRRVSNTEHDMFCPGTSVLLDGRVLVTGGSDDNNASIYNPFTDTWSRAGTLNVRRGYQGQTTLSTGEAFIVGGSWSGGEGGKTAEVYSPGRNTWRLLSGVPAEPLMTADRRGAYRADNHGWFFAVSGGRVFHAGPSKRMNWIDTSGNGSITDAGPRGDSPDAMNGNAVMYDIGKILAVGGSPQYSEGDAINRAYSVDISSGTSATVTRVGDLAIPRTFANSVVLPDGKVVVVGGMTYGVGFSDQTATYIPELWNPATGQFTKLAPMAVPRTYHSVANLLPDGRVFSGGGGLCGNCAVNHQDGQILTPPYLLNADGSPKPRPTIVAAPGGATLGGKFAITTDKPVTAFSLMRLSAITHSVDNDQRRIPLTPVSVGGNSYEVSVPADPGVALPGYYMLFAMDANGVPSVAKMVKISEPFVARVGSRGVG